MSHRPYYHNGQRVLLYEDACLEQQQDPLPTACTFCGDSEAYTAGFQNNPSVMFQCGTAWKPRSDYAKRNEPVWERYETCGTEIQTKGNDQ